MLVDQIGVGRSDWCWYKILVLVDKICVGRSDNLLSFVNAMKVLSRKNSETLLNTELFSRQINNRIAPMVKQFWTVPIHVLQYYKHNSLLVGSTILCRSLFFLV